MTGDQVFYQRKDSRRWKVPGKVIGYESSNILIKHGSQYVRVHISRVMSDKGYNDVNPTEAEVKSDTKTVSCLEEPVARSQVSTETTGDYYENQHQEQDVDEDQEQGIDEAQEQNATEDQEQDVNEDQEQDVNEDQEQGLDEVEDQEQSADEAEEMERNTANGTEAMQSETDSVSSAVNNDEAREQEATKLKKGLSIDYEVQDSLKEKGILVQRSGKATGKYKNFWYVKNLTTGADNEIDFDKVSSWKKSRSVEYYVKFTYDIFRVEKTWKIKIMKKYQKPR